MNISTHSQNTPVKMSYRMALSFCLTSLIPVLSGIYIAYMFIYEGGSIDSGRTTRACVIFAISLLLSLLGFFMEKQWISPIQKAVASARKVAKGQTPDTIDSRGSEEIEDLTRSLHAISKNAKDLLEKVEKLSPKDKLTGLYNLSYIRERLDEEIQRAAQHQHPCSFAYLKVCGYMEFVRRHGEDAAEEGLKTIAKTISDDLAIFDRAARVTKEEFALILPNRNKKKTIEIVESLLKKINGPDMSAPGSGSPEKMYLAAGVSENPMDGTAADVLYSRAEIRMKSARSRGKQLEAFDDNGKIKAGTDES